MWESVSILDRKLGPVGIPPISAVGKNMHGCFCNMFNLRFSNSATVWYSLSKFGHMHLCKSTQTHNEAETKWPSFHRRHFQSHFLKSNYCILIQISLKFVYKGPINNNPALVQMMAWCWTGDKPSSEAMMALVTDACKCHSASMSYISILWRAKMFWKTYRYTCFCIFHHFSRLKCLQTTPLWMTKICLYHI